MSFATEVRSRVVDLFVSADSAHDLSHLDRVAGLTRVLSENEGAELDIALLAVYLHDFHRVIERREDREHVPTRQAWDLTTRYLADLQVPVDDWSRIRLIIDQTSAYSFGLGLPSTWSLEAAIVHDADNLDAIGAIGIARAFAYGGALDEPLWQPDIDPSPNYQPGKTSSVIAHFYEKLLRLESDMMTATGRALARERTAVMRGFVEAFLDEWEQAMPGSADGPWRDRLAM
ncbi:HD domain-containing protein [Nocardia cyriacigeorgica]|uniref:HD domain-containing protein n=1 Tax=Nocardia cyriacigeorgica TaxID=135487 RepID=A0A6P1D827_9NOCA|nr:HD domain-containing protein [Nocardia cyriacigeorgica]NEW45681.1 HD domain-containing protein [Nocardia cyriacigeorgica]NEW55396.1 HD domain-containing protein [Nocardia cyriacigeorgica]